MKKTLLPYEYAKLTGLIVVVSNDGDIELENDIGDIMSAPKGYIRTTELNFGMTYLPNGKSFISSEHAIHEVSQEKINEIIDAYYDREKTETGLFYCKCKDGTYIAVDNLTWDCWKEEFDSKEKAISWLLGDEVDEE